jgi:hypothetical protein
VPQKCAWRMAGHGSSHLRMCAPHIVKPRALGHARHGAPVQPCQHLGATEHLDRLCAFPTSPWSPLPCHPSPPYLVPLRVLDRAPYPLAAPGPARG